MDDAGYPSLFVVAYHSFMETPYFRILQIKTPPLERPEVIKKMEVEAEYKIHFNREPQDLPPISWLLSPPTSSTEDLYLVPNWSFPGPNYARTVKPLEGYKLNFGGRLCEPIPRPLSSELDGHVVNLGGLIYVLGYDSKHGRSVFQCYDPDKKSWKALEPSPHKCVKLGRIVGTAVLGNTILFNLDYSDIRAYDVMKNKWYLVGVEDEGCYFFEGEAVTVGDTIYALSHKAFNLVLAISAIKNPNNGDLVLKCASKNLVPGLVPIHYHDDLNICRITRHLVHLGKDNFCLVESCHFVDFDFDGSQDIKVTYLRIKGENSSIVTEYLHEVKMQPTEEYDEQFDVLLCFALPMGATSAIKEEIIFNKNPFPEEVDSEEDEENDSYQTNNIDGQLGCPVHVLPMMPPLMMPPTMMPPTMPPGMMPPMMMPPMMYGGGWSMTVEGRMTVNESGIAQGDWIRTQVVGSSSSGHGSCKSELARLLNNMEMMLNRLENSRKETEYLENTVKENLKEQGRIKNEMMKAKELLNLRG